MQLLYKKARSFCSKYKESIDYDFNIDPDNGSVYKSYVTSHCLFLTEGKILLY